VTPSMWMRRDSFTATATKTRRGVPGQIRVKPIWPTEEKKCAGEQGRPLDHVTATNGKGQTRCHYGSHTVCMLRGPSSTPVNLVKWQKSRRVRRESGIRDREL